jgi:hypothetical protein
MGKSTIAGGKLGLRFLMSEVEGAANSHSPVAAAAYVLKPKHAIVAIGARTSVC